MKSLAETTTNGTKLSQAATAWDQMLDETLQRGFYGTAAIEVSIQDGTIQHIRRRMERIEK